MISRIDSVERIERSASLRTSAATTAKPLPRLARPRRFDRGIQREQVRLLGNLVDQLENLADLLRPLAKRERPGRDRLDLLLHVPHRVAGLLGGRGDGTRVVGDPGSRSPRAPRSSPRSPRPRSSARSLPRRTPSPPNAARSRPKRERSTFRERERSARRGSPPAWRSARPTRARRRRTRASRALR